MKINITFDLAPFLPWLRDYDKDKFTREYPLAWTNTPSMGIYPRLRFRD